MHPPPAAAISQGAARRRRGDAVGTAAELSDLMKPGGAAPGARDAPRTIPAACLALGANKGSRVLSMVGKTLIRSATVELPDTGPLIDQHGRYVRYEILVNRPMFEYIVQNDLYSKQGQSAFTTTVDFPSGTAAGGSNGTTGAIMVKAAWMVLGDGDDATAFHTMASTATRRRSRIPRIEESCTTATLGLVGLHVAHKHLAGAPHRGPALTPSSTRGRTRPSRPTPTNVLRRRYNFYRAGCSGCAANEPPPRPWNPNVQPFANGFTSQIVRVTPITAETGALTRAFTGLLANTVWQNYLLAARNGHPIRRARPIRTRRARTDVSRQQHVGNLYPGQRRSPRAVRELPPRAAAATTGRTSDFTFILERAQ